VLLIVLITIGATYAYFSAQAETGTQTVTTGTLTMNFDKEGSVVTINGITPIDDSEIKTKAAAFPFSITNTGTAHMNITIKLKDITIADDLKDVDFRWGLYNADTGNGVSFGIFKYAETGGEEILLRDVIIDSTDPDSTRNYTLRIWIHDDGANQNYMQGETFSGKIDVTGVAVEYTDEDCFEFDESTGTIKGYDFSYDESGNIIGGNFNPTRTGNCPKDVVIPKTINGTTVTKIDRGDVYAGEDGQGVFGDMSGFAINSIVIPDTVTTLGTGAIALSGVKSVTIPESVTTLGFQTLYGLELNNLFIPETITNYGNTLSYCSIKTLIVPSIKVLDYDVVPDNVENIILMEGLTEIYPATLGRSIDTFTSLEIPSTVTNISNSVFLGSKLTEIIVRGKTTAPAGFKEDWNCRHIESGSGSCAEYIPVIYRP